MDDGNERIPAFRGDSTKYMGSEQVRARLGTVVTYVGDTGGTMVLTDDGAPDGAIVHRDVLTQTGLEIAAEWGVREARAAWGTVRARAAGDGPQAITYRGSMAGVLADHTPYTALGRGLPILPFEELELDRTGLTLADGRLVMPGAYALRDGSVLRVHAPYRTEEH